jgi:BirA family transcriptional regulator, biotin operon repressor / biotin---[acetyl-CoA-carboxylase] ligase
MIALPEGYRLLVLDTVDSTNSEARRLLEAGEKGALWIIAKTQSKGRGRRARPWISEHGNLFASLLMPVSGDAQTCAQLSFVAALAVAEAAEELAAGRIAAKLKWPNDVLIAGKKISGILLETAGPGDDGRSRVVIGVGINLAHHPEITDYAATSLEFETGLLVMPDAAMARLASTWHDWYQIWLDQGFNPIAAAWRTRSANIGRKVRIELGNEVIEGIFEDLGPDGSAIICLEDGSQREVYAGDIFPMDGEDR